MLSYVSLALALELKSVPVLFERGNIRGYLFIYLFICWAWTIHSVVSCRVRRLPCQLTDPAADSLREFLVFCRYLDKVTTVHRADVMHHGGLSRRRRRQESAAGSPSVRSSDIADLCRFGLCVWASGCAASLRARVRSRQQRQSAFLSVFFLSFFRRASVLCASPARVPAYVPGLRSRLY